MNKNIELMGITNALVTNESPERLNNVFSHFFDKILVDAPCSGEGMFRKDSTAINSWDKYKNEECSVLQLEILNYAKKMLKPGGSIVYSTCTFSPEENEQVIDKSLKNNSDFYIKYIPENKEYGLQDGRINWCNNQELEKAIRIWPHKAEGEGHFTVVLVNKNINNEQKKEPKYNTPPEIVTDFYKENLKILPQGFYYQMGRNIYILPEGLYEIPELKIEKAGLIIGSIENNRFSPSQSLIMALKKDNILNTINLNSNSLDALKYLKGETIVVDGKKGLTGILIDGFPVGWGKINNGALKNLYPKGWRKLK